MCPDKDNLIGKAAIAAIAVGLLVTILLAADTVNDSYSSLYLKPDSYQNYITKSRISFTYGVKSFEKKKTDYDIKVFLGKNQVMEKGFTLYETGMKEETLSFDLPGNTAFPLKVTILLNNGKENYEVHYWIKGKQ
jgi:hypothetical protein